MAIEKDGFIHIGIPWGFNEWTDVDNYYTDLIYSNISVVDFIPIIPKLNKKIAEDDKKTKDEGILAKILKELYIPDPDKGCAYYNGLLKRFGLAESCSQFKGVRLYLTDNTQLAETLNNEYSESVFGQTAKALTERVAGNLIKPLGEINRAVKGTLYAPPEQVIQALTGGGNNVGSIMSNMKTVEALLSGLRVDFPVIWQNTNYARRTTLNVVLSTPYGAPEAVWVWIVRPLLFLLLLGTPVNWNGPIGYPLYISVRSHGLFYMQMAAIESITIDRGGQNTVFNVYKQPLKVVLNITIRDLFSSLSIDPDVNMSKEDVVSWITNPRSDFDITSVDTNSMPTVDKLVKSFAPQPIKNKDTSAFFKSRLDFNNASTPKPMQLASSSTAQNMADVAQTNLDKTTQYIDKERNSINNSLINMDEDYV
jgi:hypothetical protein